MFAQLVQQIQQTRTPVDTILRQYAKQHQTPFLLFDPQTLKENYTFFRTMLPSVDVYYALKACSEPMVVNTVNQLGAYFDVSSIGELTLLNKLGIDTCRCFYTHPHKKSSDIARSIQLGCRHFVFDCAAELHKFIPYKDTVSLCLRIGFTNNNAQLDLSSKFGCHPSEAVDLLMRAHHHGLTTSRLAFHVGSQSTTTDTFEAAITFCAGLIDSATIERYAMIDTLDIGGGFPVAYANQTIDLTAFFRRIADTLRLVPNNIRLIAEPGRFLVAPAVTSIASIVAKNTRNNVACYYLDDGIYGTYSGIIYDQMVYRLHHVFQNQAVATSTPFKSTLFGSSCDSNDIIARNILLPSLSIGDYIIGHAMGAYTIAHATEFSCFKKPTMVSLQQ